MKSESAVFLAGSVPPTTEKPKASAKDAKANTEWVHHVPFTLVLLRREELTSVDSAMSIALVLGGLSSERVANNMTQLFPTSGLKII